MRIAFFGGTFDPPHRAHLTVARAAAAKFSLDTILFAPAGQQPLKPDGSSASFADRLAMVELLCESGRGGSLTTRFVPSALDRPREDGQPNYTIDALKQLRAEFEGAEIFSIIGADAFLDLRRWREPDALLQIAEWIVVSRPGFALADLAPLALTPAQRARVYLLDGIHEPHSASDIRERLQAGADCSALVTPEVLDYIREHRLYLSSAADAKY